MEEKIFLSDGVPLFADGVPERVKEMCRWPIITEEDEAAALDVVRHNTFSGVDITEKFEKEFADWLGVKHAVCYANGTMALAAAMFAIGLSQGDEIICPTKTYWASILPAVSFGAVPVFAGIDDMLSLDPDDLERVISPKTKAIVVVHYIGYPADMDRIMAVARKHGLKVIEDVSHAQGGLYKGRRLGTFGDVAAMSLMSTKSFAAGELGIAVTNDQRTYERALAYGHYDRNNSHYVTESEELLPFSHIALGAVKGRANQLCAAIARVQLKYYDERCAEIRRAMNYFWDCLEGLPGIRAIRVDERTGSNMAGFYAAQGRYYPEELDGLPIKTFASAVIAQIGCPSLFWVATGANNCLHTHEYFKSFDLDGGGSPSCLRYATRDVRALDEALKSSEEKLCFGIPLFVKYDEEWIGKIANCFRLVIENHRLLLSGGESSTGQGGHWHGFKDHDA